jgi:hypothetical protein
MANSHYEVLEFRVLFDEDLTQVYIRCSQDEDGLVGGWYHKTFPPKEPAIEILIEAFRSQDYLFWGREAPKL